MGSATPLEHFGWLESAGCRCMVVRGEDTSFIEAADCLVPYPQQDARANATVRHASCFRIYDRMFKMRLSAECRTSRAGRCRGSSLTLGGIRSFFEMRTSEMRIQGRPRFEMGFESRKAAASIPSGDSHERSGAEDFERLVLVLQSKLRSNSKLISPAHPRCSEVCPTTKASCACEPYGPTRRQSQRPQPSRRVLSKE